MLNLTDEEREGLSATDMFRVDITPYFICLIDPDDPDDPIRRQVIPLGREHEAFTGMMEDSLAEDRHSPVPGLVHRYPDRVLMLVTTQCATYCRYCTRSRIVGDPTQTFSAPSSRRRSTTCSAPRRSATCCSPAATRWCWPPSCWRRSSAACARSRTSRSSASAAACRSSCPAHRRRACATCWPKYHPLWLNIHVNHPNEITPELARGLRPPDPGRHPAGQPVGAAGGVNDCVHIQRELVHDLVRIRVRPYYLYQCDLVEGPGHFRTPVAKGIEIMEGLRGHTSGYAVPTTWSMRPAAAARSRSCPTTCISMSDHKVVLRNYEGYITTYEEPMSYRSHDSTRCEFCRHPRMEPGQSGVAGLLGGDQMWIEPSGFAEIHSRGATDAHRLQQPEKWVPYGIGAIRGQPPRGDRRPPELGTADDREQGG